MKLGAPKFILPFLFVTYPSIITLTFEGFLTFILTGIGSFALSAGMQSGWGWWQQGILFALGIAIIISPLGIVAWVIALITVVLMTVLWRKYADKVVPRTVVFTES